LCSRSRSACMSLNGSTTASIRCLNRGPIKYWWTFVSRDGRDEASRRADQELDGVMC
jgi:hypothetical protein